MIPEDIMTGLTTLSASDNMNARQRDLMTEGSALIKFQQHQLREAHAAQKDAESYSKNMDAINDNLRSRIASLLALCAYWRKQLCDLSTITEADMATIDREEA